MASDCYREEHLCCGQLGVQLGFMHLSLFAVWCHVGHRKHFFYFEVCLKVISSQFFFFQNLDNSSPLSLHNNGSHVFLVTKRIIVSVQKILRRLFKLCVKEAGSLLISCSVTLQHSNLYRSTGRIQILYSLILELTVY